MPTNYGNKQQMCLKDSTIGRAKIYVSVQVFRWSIMALSRIAPHAAARCVQRLFFLPQRIALRDEQRTVLRQGDQFTLFVQGQRVPGWSWGEGPVVALVHGWGGRAGQMTPLVAPLVRAGYMVVAWDMPGYGASGGRESSIVHFAATLQAVATRFGPLHGVLAHSLGAAASTYALSRGLPVERAVFFAPPAQLAPLWARFRKEFGVADVVWQRMIERSQAWLQTNFNDLVPITLAPHLHIPLLIIHDTHDREVAYADGVALATHWPDAMMPRPPSLGIAGFYVIRHLSLVP